MTFEGPESRDYENVVSLNLAWLECLKHDRAAGTGPAAGPSPHVERLRQLNATESARLAESPFLLFSFRERDHEFWDQVFARRVGSDLFDTPQTGMLATLTHAALGFVWQLAGRNPYALRLFCGASLYWCECIADLTFIRLLDAVRSARDVPVLRLAGNRKLWEKLTHEGVSRNNRTRHAAQFAALQTILTDSAGHDPQASLARAARKADAPGLRVTADR
jgi:hypothetical protein